MKRIRNITFFLFILLSGCTFSNGVEPSPAAIGTQMIQSLSTPTANLATTQESQKSCNLSGGVLPVKSEGKIIFQVPDMSPDMGLYFYDVQDGQKYIIPNTEGAFNPYVASSPDHEKVAFFDIKSGNVVIISADGTPTELITKDKIDGVFYGWLDNNNIIFVERSHFDGSIITLDSNTGNVDETTTGLHDLFSLGPNNWYAGGDQPSVIFDSTLSRMVYLSGELPGESIGKWGFIMRDRNTQNVLWSRSSADLGTKPKWSPDNEYIAVAAGNKKIYIINKNGEEIKEIDTADTGATLIEWSPDGKKLSYVFFNYNEKLVVYDLASDQAQQYTVHQETGRIVWSPDSKQIATAGSLVDLSTNCVFTINADNQSEPNPLAWLVESP
ncbi:MAG: hypothetical protein HOP27_01275 [Anaerolineales bacterium]|nr:hypothetical protein [Anaerolineales bacterium]